MNEGMGVGWCQKLSCRRLEYFCVLIETREATHARRESRGRGAMQWGPSSVWVGTVDLTDEKYEEGRMMVYSGIGLITLKIVGHFSGKE